MPRSKPYTPKELFSLAARVNNTKRSYLLVNPLQAKHIPVSPRKTVELCQALAQELPPACHSASTLVIGFAETATAVGALLAAALHPDCRYLTTTRETWDSRFLYFSEVHSHAAEQKLCCEKLAALLDGVTQLILIDDELTTGNTILNLLDCLSEFLPAGIAVTAASLINRMNPAARERFAARGVGIAALVYSPDTDATEQSYTAATTGLSLTAPTPCTGTDTLPDACAVSLEFSPRSGIFSAGDYRAACRGLSDKIIALLPENARRIAVLGTEECMAPAIWAGEALEERLPDCEIRCHATTRSPIGIVPRVGYPIQNGVALPSCYDTARATFLYNLAAYDAAVIVTDGADAQGCSALCAALRDAGTARIFTLSLHCSTWNNAPRKGALSK